MGLFSKFSLFFLGGLSYTLLTATLLTQATDLGTIQGMKYSFIRISRILQHQMMA